MFLKCTRPDQNFVSSLAPLPTPSPAKKALEPPLPLSRRPSPIRRNLGGLDVEGGWLSVAIFSEKESSLSSSVLPGLSGTVYSRLVSADAPKGSR